MEINNPTSNNKGYIIFTSHFFRPLVGMVLGFQNHDILSMKILNIYCLVHYNIQYTLYILHYTFYSIHNTIYNIQCTKDKKRTSTMTPYLFSIYAKCIINIHYTIYTTPYINIINASTVTPSSFSTYSGSAPHLRHS